VTTARYTHKCDACGKEHVEEFQVARGYPLPNPCPPAEWARIGDYSFCGDHQVDIIVDPLIDQESPKVFKIA